MNLQDGRDEMKFEIAQDSFRMDGGRVFLLSGEIHYFRTPVSTWDTHLARLKECGANAVTFYIPWSWHEPEKDTCDFDGRTDPNRSLTGWLEAIKRAGLYCMVKPGPYMLAEYEDKGIPPWLTDDREIMSRQVDMVTYMHPKYLNRVEKWYDRIFEVLSPWQYDRGGPILMMQICNEIGLFNWLAGSADYSETVAAYYRKYLQEKFGEIEHLNGAYGEKHDGFETVQPPKEPPKNLPGLARWIDFHEFHRHYFARYLGHLEGQARRRGITVPFYHNIAGWVYGQALEYSVNISMYREIAKQSPGILLAADHIPENVSYRNAHHGSLVTRAVAALKQEREVSFVAEMQAGSREDCVLTYPVELELFYKKSLGDGVKGMNLYMFSQGKNPERRGAFGPTFYWQTALDYNANRLPLYDTVQRLGRFLKNFGPGVTAARRKAGTGVVFYWPYWQTELFYPLFERKTLIDPAGLGIDFDMKQYREAVLVDTWIKFLDRSNVSYDIVDLQAASRESLSSYEKLIVLTLPFMDGESQEKLAGYVKDGGSLFFGPSIPRWDLSFEACDTLGKALGVEKGDRIEEAKIDVPGCSYVACMAHAYSIESKGDQQVLAVSSKEKKPCCIRKSLGRGSFTWLSAVFSHATVEHAAIFNDLALKDLSGGRVVCSKPRVSASCLYSDAGSWLFAGNVHQEALESTISLPGLLDGEIPVTLPPKASIFAPVNLPLPGGAGKIVYSTADVIEIISQDGKVIMDVYRERGSCSRVLLELSFRPAAVSLDGMAVAHSTDEKGRTLLSLEHNGKIQRLQVE
jgi:beta-galactosidase